MAIGVTLQEDHPRICGEKYEYDKLVDTLSGSPPHMRGKGVEKHKNVSIVRITPAYAGKRLKRSHKIVLFINKPIIFHSVCNRLDITNNNPTVLCAAVLW